jgi:hypothetical protein
VPITSAGLGLAGFACGGGRGGSEVRGAEEATHPQATHIPLIHSHTHSRPGPCSGSCSWPCCLHRQTAIKSRKRGKEGGAAEGARQALAYSVLGVILTDR